MTLRSFFSSLWRGLDALRKALHLIVLLVIFGIALGVLLSGAARIPARAALLIEPEGELVEQLSGDPFTRALAVARVARRVNVVGRRVVGLVAITLENPKHEAVLRAGHVIELADPLHSVIR